MFVGNIVEAELIPFRFFDPVIRLDEASYFTSPYIQRSDCGAQLIGDTSISRCFLVSAWCVRKSQPEYIPEFTQYPKSILDSSLKLHYFICAVKP